MISHHDNFMSMQHNLSNKVRRLRNIMDDYCNPFLEDSGDIYKLDSNDTVHADKGKLLQLKQTGCNQYANSRTQLHNNQTFMNL